MFIISQKTRLAFLILINIFCFTYIIFGQDSLLIDTTVQPFISPFQDQSVDSVVEKNFTKNNKKKNIINRVQNLKTLKVPVIKKNENIQDVNTHENNNGHIFIGALIIIVIAVLLHNLTRFDTSKTNNKNITISSKDDDFLSDYINRTLLSRRGYYRNVYLKSEAWKRKRYLVLKRDNWKCVYCGGRATQVHHKRYAKINIGKEPIEWLVSICEKCHDAKH